MVLFDEIEKAHNDVFNVFLQILDDGRLTDGQGRVVNFRNTIIIMTSNIGSQEILNVQQKGGDYEGMKQRVLGMLRQNFRPEFLNRVDEVIVFHALEKVEIEKIAAMLLEKLAQRFHATTRATLTWDDKALDYVARNGYDPAYGARPLKRLIQQEVETRLSRIIISGDIKPEDQVLITANESDLELTVIDNDAR